MEEAEALATKMGIMVSGNLECIGTSQHIKNKFGGGYEIEVKLEPPVKAEIDAVIQRLEPGYQGTIDQSSVGAVLQSLHAAELLHEIREDGTGSAIFTELNKGKISADLLVEWVLIEKHGNQLQVRKTRDLMNNKYFIRSSLERILER